MTSLLTNLNSTVDSRGHITFERKDISEADRKQAIDTTASLAKSERLKSIAIIVTAVVITAVALFAFSVISFGVIQLFMELTDSVIISLVMNSIVTGVASIGTYHLFKKYAVAAAEVRWNDANDYAAQNVLLIKGE